MKLSLFVDDMLLYTENFEDVARQLLELLRKFIKVAGDTSNIQKSVTFLYTNDKLSHREISNPIYKISSHKISRSKLNQRGKRLILKL